MQSTKKMLVVDDVELNRAILSELFGNTYEMIEAENGQEALDVLKEQSQDISIVLLDIVMPVMDGLTALQEINRLGYLKYMPVVMVTAESTESISLQMYEIGASDVISKPFNPAVVRQRVDNIVELYDYRRDLEEVVREQTVILEEQAEKLRQTNVFVIDTLCTAVEFRDGESGTHIVRIRDITRLLLKEFGARHSKYRMTDERIEVISNAAAMHDIGKIAVPDAILNKPGKLTREEFEIMKLHTIKGCEMLAKLDYVQDQEYYEYCYDICRHHHERWDGRGYPDGIKGDDISIWAQVVALADVYDALVSERTYKKAFTHETAVQMIANGECGQFNPELIACFLEISSELKMMYVTIAKEHAAPPPQPFVLEAPKQDDNLQRILKLLELERAKYHIIADSSGEIVFEYNLNEDRIHFSENVGLLLNCPIEIKNLLQEKQEYLVVYEPDFKLLGEALNDIMANSAHTVRKMIRLKTRDGEYEWFEAVARGIFTDEAREPQLTDVIGKLVNVNELKVEANRWRTVAHTDPLTNLDNSMAFQERVFDAMESGDYREGAILFIDVDDFKRVNSEYGRAMGDLVLRFVGERLQTLFRSSDMLGRIGGDEFAVFMPGVTDVALLREKSQLLCDTVAAAKVKNEQGDVCDSFSISVGIARYPSDAKDYHTLVHQADEALKKAKTKGKNSFHFFDEELN